MLGELSRFCYVTHLSPPPFYVQIFWIIVKSQPSMIIIIVLEHRARLRDP